MQMPRLYVGRHFTRSPPEKRIKTRKPHVYSAANGNVKILLNMKTIRELFPKASNAFIKANEKALNAIAPDIRAADKTFTPDPPKATRRGLMNRTEREFALILQSQKQQGEILRYDFEAITLRWPVGDQLITYTADFAVFPHAYAMSSQIRLIEVKGNYIKGKFERAVERFRHAKTYYGDRFLFELWQKTRAEGWKRLI